MKKIEDMFKSFLYFDLLTVIEDASVGEEEVKKAGALAQLQGVAPLIAQQGRHVDRKVLNRQLFKYINSLFISRVAKLIAKS